MPADAGAAGALTAEPCREALPPQRFQVTEPGEDFRNCRNRDQVGRPLPKKGQYGTDADVWRRLALPDFAELALPTARAAWIAGAIDFGNNLLLG